MKGIWKLASRVFKTCLLLAELDTFMPHRSQVFYTRFQNTQDEELQTQKKKKTQKKERRKKEEGNPAERIKERRRSSTAKKKTHGTHKPSLHQAHPDRRFTVKFMISITEQTI